jgi:O-antigen ligase
LSTNITSGRQFIAQNELQLFRENLLLGVGLSYSKFIRLQQSSSFVNTHNEITRTLAEQGLIGAIGIIALVSISLKAYRRRNSLNRATFWALGAFFLVTLSSIAMRLSATSFVFGLAIVFVTQSRPPLPNWHSRNTQLRMAR